MVLEGKVFAFEDKDLKGRKRERNIPSPQESLSIHLKSSKNKNLPKISYPYLGIISRSQLCFQYFPRNFLNIFSLHQFSAEKNVWTVEINRSIPFPCEDLCYIWGFFRDTKGVENEFLYYSYFFLCQGGEY